MRLIYIDLWGRKHVREFESWRACWQFILRNYPIFQVANDLGLIKLQK